MRDNEAAIISRLKSNLSSQREKTDRFLLKFTEQIRVANAVVKMNKSITMTRVFGGSENGRYHAIAYLLLYPYFFSATI